MQLIATSLDQFSRTTLQLGYDNMCRLRSSKVAVFGVGGVGGYCIEALARTGIGTLDLFDDDQVSLTNINRQIIATHKTLGLYKVDVMRERILEINPLATVGAYRVFYSPETATEVNLSGYSYIVDAVDTLSAKVELVSRALASGIPIISSMGAANKLDPTAFEVADISQTSVCPLARVMRKELRKRGITTLKVVYSTEPPRKPPASLSPQDASRNTQSRQVPASNAFVPPVAGLILAGEVIKDLCAQ